MNNEKTRWCYGCNEIKPLDYEHFAWVDKEHTKFRNKCRQCTNLDSKISKMRQRLYKKNKVKCI